MLNGGQSTANARGDKIAASLVAMPKTATDKRLTVVECRKILGTDCDLTDAEIQNIRDQLYALATLSVTEFATGKGSREERCLAKAALRKAA
jgi:hypothetical protein